MTYSIRLTQSEAGLGGIELARSATVRLAQDGLSLPTPPLQPQYARGGGRDGAELVDEAYGNRTITMRLILNGSPSVIRETIQTINHYLDSASAHARMGIGAPTTLALQLTPDSPVVIFDVLSGSFNPFDAHSGILYRQGLVANADLVLECRPFGRGAPIEVEPTGVVPHTGAAVLDLPYLDSDAPGLLQLRVSDQSTSGWAINKLVIASYHSNTGGQVGRRTFVHAFGGDQPESDSLTGLVSAHTLLPEWEPATPPLVLGAEDDLFENSGWARVLVRASYRPDIDEPTIGSLPPPQVQTVQTRPGGTLGTPQSPTVYYYGVTTIDQQGRESLLSNVRSGRTMWAMLRSLLIRWSNVANRQAYRLYRRSGATGAWQWRNVGTNTWYYDTGASGWTTGDPPQAQQATIPTQPLMRVDVAEAGSGASWQESGSVVVDNPDWRLYDLGPLRLPPGNLPSSVADAGWQLRVMGRQTVGAGQLWVDCVYLLPYQSTVSAEIRTPTPSSERYLWIAEQGLDERVVAVRAPRNGEVTRAGGAVATGRMRVPPGYTRVFVTVEQAERRHRISGVQLRLSARITPRYLTI